MPLIHCTISSIFKRQNNVYKLKMYKVIYAVEIWFKFTAIRLVFDCIVDSFDISRCGNSFSAYCTAICNGAVNVVYFDDVYRYVVVVKDNILTKLISCCLGSCLQVFCFILKGKLSLNKLFNRSKEGICPSNRFNNNSFRTELKRFLYKSHYKLRWQCTTWAFSFFIEKGANKQVHHLIVSDQRHPWTSTTLGELQVRCSL